MTATCAPARPEPPRHQVIFLLFLLLLLENRAAKQCLLKAPALHCWVRLWLLFLVLLPRLDPYLADASDFRRRRLLPLSSIGTACGPHTSATYTEHGARTDPRSASALTNEEPGQAWWGRELLCSAWTGTNRHRPWRHHRRQFRLLFVYFFFRIFLL